MSNDSSDTSARILSTTTSSFEHVEIIGELPRPAAPRASSPSSSSSFTLVSAEKNDEDSSSAEHWCHVTVTPQGDVSSSSSSSSSRSSTAPPAMSDNHDDETRVEQDCGTPKNDAETLGPSSSALCFSSTALGTPSSLSSSTALSNNANAILESFYDRVQDLTRQAEASRIATKIIMCLIQGATLAASDLYQKNKQKLNDESINSEISGYARRRFDEDVVNFYFPSLLLLPQSPISSAAESKSLEAIELELVEAERELDTVLKLSPAERSALFMPRNGEFNNDNNRNTEQFDAATAAREVSESIRQSLSDHIQELTSQIEVSRIKSRIIQLIIEGSIVAASDIYQKNKEKLLSSNESGYDIYIYARRLDADIVDYYFPDLPKSPIAPRSVFDEVVEEEESKTLEALERELIEAKRELEMIDASPPISF